MILVPALLGLEQAGIPRESGDDPPAPPGPVAQGAYSPRERG